MRAKRDSDFDEWFRLLYPRARSVAARVVGPGADAEDLAAEAFARAYARWWTVRRLPHRDAWVLRVTANLALDKARRRPASVLPEAPVDDTDAAVSRLVLQAALDSLPPRQRDAVTLHHLAGMPVAEVAAALGVSANTVKTHLGRASTTLRNTLALEADHG